MPEVRWIKITVDMFDDEKIKIIQSMPEGDAILVVWIRLITMAGKCNAGGYIYLTDSIPYTVEMLAVMFSKPPNIIRMALETFQGFGMIEIDDHGIALVNWEKHQNIDGLEKIQEQNRSRQAKFYARRKAITLPNVSITLSSRYANGDITQQSTDKEIEEEREIDPKPSTNKNTVQAECVRFEEFWAAYPRRYGKAAALRCWKARINDKAEPDAMIRAAVIYAEECAAKHTEERFIKHASTFIGADRWYQEYAERGTNGTDGNGRRLGAASTDGTDRAGFKDCISGVNRYPDGVDPFAD